ncbi:MAG: hypothetical protein KDK70_28510 [Myxococcales bacterium]|nr:hypothetical protein [Myxococcales bacterium]
MLLLGLLLAPGIASASAANRAIDPESTETSEGATEGGWGPIVGACLGVLFGGTLAVWQIRNLKNRS